MGQKFEMPKNNLTAELQTEITSHPAIWVVLDIKTKHKLSLYVNCRRKRNRGRLIDYGRIEYE